MPFVNIRLYEGHGKERKEEIASRLDDRPATPFELARAMFKDLEGFDNFLAVSEVVAHRIVGKGVAGYLEALDWLVAHPR